MQAFMFLTLQAGLLFLLWSHCSASVATDCTPEDSGCTRSNAADVNAAQSSKVLMQAFRKTHYADNAKMQREPEQNDGIDEEKDDDKEEDKEEATEEEAKEDDKEEDDEDDSEEVKDEEKQEEEDKEEAKEEDKAEEGNEEKEEAKEDDKEEDMGENNEESEAAPAPPSQPAKPPLWSATLDQAGYDFVKGLGCQYEQELFARRVVTDLGHHVCDERGIRDVVTKHFQVTAALSYDDFRSQILEGKEGKCPWLNINDDDADRCPKDLPEECPEKLCEDCEWKDVEGWHRRRTCQRKNPGFDKITNVESNFFEEEEGTEAAPKALVQFAADTIHSGNIVQSAEDLILADAAQKSNASLPKANIELCAAGENEVCTCSGTVFYGRKHMDGMPGSGEVATFEQMKTSDYKSKTVSGSIECSETAMGGDPLWGHYKHCYCEAGNSEGAPAVFAEAVPAPGPEAAAKSEAAPAPGPEAAEKSKATPAPSAVTVVPAPLWSATLNQEGYNWVKNLNCQYEHELFVRRVVSDLGHHVCDERGVKDIVTEHFRGKSTLNFEDMKKKIKEGKDGKCPWLNINDDDANRCAASLPPECPEKLCEDCEWKDVEGWHRRRTCQKKNPGFDKISNVKSDYFD